jgi:thiamine biosynthesis lipoprotein
MTFHCLTEWCALLSAHPLPKSQPGGVRAETSEIISVARDVLKRPLLQSISSDAMGCAFEVLLNERQYPLGVQAATESLKQINHLESLLSVYKPQSQLSKVNRFASERPVLVDASTFQMVQLALDIHQMTGGAYDITAGSLSEAWGFARRQGSMPTQDQIDAARNLVGSELIRLDCQACTISLTRHGVQLNPGGIGKGFALDTAARLLVDSGVRDFMIHGGLSSIIACGRRSTFGESGWRVALKHPWRSEETLETICLSNQALATSGSGKQFFHFKGKRYSHLIDPRTGWPADQMMSATVICPSGGVADALATGLFILGPQKAVQFCEAHPEISAILVFLDPKSGSQRIERCNWQ